MRRLIGWGIVGGCLLPYDLLDLRSVAWILLWSFAGVLMLGTAPRGAS